MRRVISLLCIAVGLLGFIGISEGFDPDHGSLNWPNPQLSCNSYEGQTVLVAGIDFPHGQNVSIEELGSITGKGLPKATAGWSSKGTDKIILWDEASFHGTSGLSLSNETNNNMSNSQINRLIINGR